MRLGELGAEELREQRTRELTALRESGVAYHHVSRSPVVHQAIGTLRQGRA